MGEGEGIFLLGGDKPTPTTPGMTHDDQFDKAK